MYRKYDQLKRGVVYKQSMCSLLCLHTIVHVYIHVYDSLQCSSMVPIPIVHVNVMLYRVELPQV